MARSDFGGTGYDFVADAFNFAGRTLLDLAPAELTFWSAQTGGTQHTDLLLSGSPVASITVGDDGQVPAFKGPDGVKAMWASTDNGVTRFLIVAFAPEALLLAPAVLVPANTAIGTLIFRTS